MSGMCTMLPLTQVLRERERRETGERQGRREPGTLLYVSRKAGAGNTCEEDPFVQ